MKRISFPISLFLLVLLILGCDTTETTKTKDPNELGGDQNIPLNTVGNKFTTSVNIMGIPDTTIKGTIEIIKNENGVFTLRASADLTHVPELSKINNLIPVRYIYRFRRGYEKYLLL